MIKAMDHVNIVVSNLQEATEFFTAIGFTISSRGDLQSDWVSDVVGLSNAEARYVQLSLSESRTRLELIHYSSPASGRDIDMGKANQIGIRHLAFEVNDIDSVVAALKERKVTFFSDIKTYEPLSKRLVYFHGPDGIILELAEYGD
jgi:catechol 2,3-dioxygenase-like lactoylglutathione lyase family enzyme